MQRAMECLDRVVQRSRREQRIAEIRDREDLVKILHINWERQKLLQNGKYFKDPVLRGIKRCISIAASVVDAFVRTAVVVDAYLCWLSLNMTRFGLI